MYHTNLCSSHETMLQARRIHTCDAFQRGIESAAAMTEAQKARLSVRLGSDAFFSSGAMEHEVINHIV